MGTQVQRGRPVRRRIGALILIVAVLGRSTLYAQLPSRALTTVAAVEPGAPPVEQTTDSVRLLVGRSTIVDVGRPIARVSLTSSDIADALVTSPNELLINGKAAGTISMFVWDRAGAIRRYEVVVQRDLARLSAQLKELFPKESIEVRANGKAAVLSGTVSSKDVADKMASLAGSFVETKEELVSLLQVGPAGRSNQVLLRVRFAEVSRSAMTELGVSFFTGAAGYKDYLARTTTDQFPAPVFDNSNPGQPKLVFSDFLNLFLFNTKEQLGGVIKALQTKGLFQSLAEPNLIAESGKEASFLAGGEFPVPIAQGSGTGGTSISVQFKEFGIRLTFTPVVNGDRVHLKVRPEVSTLDFTNAVVLNGFRIPALSTRRTETEVELNDGQTFAIAGLMNNTMNTTMQKIPGIGDIPVLGLLFKSKAAQKNQTELVVMITPEILANNSPGVTPNIPRQVEPYLPPLPQKQTIDPPPPAFRPSAGVQAGTAVPTSTTATTATPAAGTPDAQKAATAMKALSPATRAPNVHADAATATPDTPSANASSKPTSANASSKPMTAQEQKAQERAQKQEQEVARANAEEARRLAKQAEENQRKQKIEDERQAKLAHEQAVRDDEAAKRQAEVAKKQAALENEAAKKQAARDAEVAKKQAARDAEAAKKQAAHDAEAARIQAEADKQRQKTIAEAEVRLKAAEAAYQAELAKKQHP